MNAISNACPKPDCRCSTISASIRTPADFTPIFHQIEDKHPDVIMTGISHVGVQPTVQWHDQQVPMPMVGQSSQATTSTFWKDTNGAAEGVITGTAAAADVALTPVTIPFAEAYVKKHGVTPAYVGYSAYDMVHVIAEAIERAGGSTDPDKLVTALEATDHVGSVGRIQFYGRDNQFTHAMKYGPGSGHHHRHSMAERQAGVRLADRQVQRQGQLSVVRQNAELSLHRHKAEVGSGSRLDGRVRLS